MNATYTPTAVEIAAGSATVTLTTTGQLAPCAAASATMTITIYTGPSTANAGPNQLVSGTVSLTNGVQLAGSVANGPSTWSGGAGTFSPNANTTNAVYYPSAAEVAAGSMVVTLTASASPCGGGPAVSTMTITYQQLLTLPFNTNTSTLQITLMLNPSSGTTDFGSQSQSGTRNTFGYMALELDNPDSPTQITVRDLRMTAMSPYFMAYQWSFSGVPIPESLIIGSVTSAFVNSSFLIYDSSPGNGAPTTLTPDSGAGGGSFTVQMPFSSSGAAYFGGTALGSLDLSLNYAPVNMTGNIHVTNDVATAHIDFTVTTNINITGTISVIYQPTFVGHADMVGPTILPRYLMWNNGAGTFNWNTNDLNWNFGTAKWDSRRPDNANFGATGIGTVNLTMPITAGSLWFQNPGYTIAGSSPTG